METHRSLTCSHMYVADVITLIKPCLQMAVFAWWIRIYMIYQWRLHHLLFYLPQVINTAANKTLPHLQISHIKTLYNKKEDLWILKPAKKCLLDRESQCSNAYMLVVCWQGCCPSQAISCFITLVLGDSKTPSAIVCNSKNPPHLPNCKLNPFSAKAFSIITDVLIK